MMMYMMLIMCYLCLSQSLNEEILSRKKTVDQAIKNGQALLKQTTGNLTLLDVLITSSQMK